ncbi:MAG: diguanylate cyclase [Desulfovibrionaceae bacterium]|nr:diguanylate cyclase [Desulfovibrionaceae bacterium]
MFRQAERRLGLQEVNLLAVAGRALLLWLPLVALYGVLLWQSWGEARDHRMAGVFADQQAEVDLLAETLQAEVRARVGAVRSLAELPPVARLLGGAPGEARAEVEEVFMAVARANPDFDQVRVLDATGREVVRVDRSGPTAAPGAVPASELQDKSRRYYFMESMRMPPGGVYLSPMDLNVEHGLLEVPHKPMLRFGIPVDRDGRRLGVVVVNYLGRLLLDALSGPAVGRMGAVGLCNGQGYWLKALAPGEEWGFQLPGGRDWTLARRAPEIWAQTATLRRFQTLADAGLYSVRWVRPLPLSSEGLGMAGNAATAAATGNASGSVLGGAPEGATAGMPGSMPGSAQENGREGAAADGWWLVSLVEAADVDAVVRPVIGSHAQSAVLVCLLFGVGALGLALAYERRKQGLAFIRRQYDLLAQAEGKLRAVMESSHDALVITDAAGLVEYWNAAAESMFGYSAAEAIGRPVHELVAAAEDRELARQRLTEFARTGQGAIVGAVSEFLARRKGGDRFSAELALTAFRYDGAWHAASAVRDITERKETERRLKEMAATDGLTGLFNRRHFLEVADAELKRARRFGNPLALLMFDVDHFKRVNDTLGHAAGDAVLRRMAVVCTRVLRTVDVVGRIGGEEFAALLPETGADAAREVAERLRGAVEAEEVEHGATVVRCTVSVGVAALVADADVDALLKRADTALYRAKESGRNRVVVDGAGLVD